MDQEVIPETRTALFSSNLRNDDQALVKVDALATMAVGWVAPIHFTVAQSEAERQAAYRLRYQTVIERGWLKPEDLPNGVEYDKYDDQAIQILGWDGEKAVATCRLILPAPGLRLPTEVAFDLQV
jgi:hypothetical protein